MLLIAVISSWHGRGVIIWGLFPAVYSVIIIRSINPRGSLSPGCYDSRVWQIWSIILDKWIQCKATHRIFETHKKNDPLIEITPGCLAWIESPLLKGGSFSTLSVRLTKKEEYPDNYFPLPGLWIAAMEEIIIGRVDYRGHSGSEMEMCVCKQRRLVELCGGDFLPHNLKKLHCLP